MRRDVIRRLKVIGGAVDLFFGRAEDYQETTIEKFATWLEAGIGPCRRTVKRLYSGRDWRDRRHEWMRKRMLAAMEEVYAASSLRKEFTAKNIIKKTGATNKFFMQLVGDEWRALAQALPAYPPDSPRLLQGGDGGLTLREALRAGRYEELKRGQGRAEDAPPEGADVCVYPGGWVDLGEDVWHFRTISCHFRKDRLREDVAAVAWPLLADEFRSGQLSHGTIQGHYRGFIAAGGVLGRVVTDVRAATLEKAQKAWAACALKGGERKRVRHAMVRLFASLYSLSKTDPRLDGTQMLSIASWLMARAKVVVRPAGRAYLSERELDDLISCCLADIKAGFTFLASRPNLLLMSPLPGVRGSASAVTYLGVALMILLMAFTGLRRRSVVSLEVGDLMQVRPAVGAVAWGHPKKREQGLVLTPLLVERLITRYVELTGDVRDALFTKRIFFTGGKGRWGVFNAREALNDRLNDFVERHELLRDGARLPLTPNSLRRSYATHQMYRGRSIAFIGAQLGHLRVESTESYVQFDRYEHPAHVRDALDNWGGVLNLWHSPADVGALDAEAVGRIFGDPLVGPAAEDGSDDLSPCELCEHLRTGPEFREGWDAELKRRGERPKGLGAAGDEEVACGEERELELFLSNYHTAVEGVNN